MYVCISICETLCVCARVCEYSGCIYVCDTACVLCVCMHECAYICACLLPSVMKHCRAHVPESDFFFGGGGGSQF